MIKICYIVSSVNKAIAFEWIAHFLDPNTYKLSFILLNDPGTEIGRQLRALGKDVYEIPLPSKKAYPIVFLKTYRTLKRIDPDIVHTHLRDADLIGLTLAKFTGIKTRITTRHSSTYNHIWHPNSVKWDKYINSSATKIVAISKTVKRVLVDREGVDPKKIELIQHGFDLRSFDNISNERVAALQKKYAIPNGKLIIGVIARYIEWKGIHFVIPAIKELIKKGMNLHLVLANAHGPYKPNIDVLLSELGRDHYTEIDFEPDLFALYKVFDIYVHTPIDHEVEAFGQTYVEALASGLPSVFTLSGIANDFVEHKKNALVVDFKSTDQIRDAILQLTEDTELRESLALKGRESVDQFALSGFIKNLEKLYNQNG